MIVGFREFEGQFSRLELKIGAVAGQSRWCTV